MSAATTAIVAGAIGAAGSIGSAVIGANAQGDAAETQAAAAAQAAQLRSEAGDKAVELQKPFLEGGLEAFQGLQDLPDFQAPTVTDDPGYAFRLQQGQQALERSAAARGGLTSGGTAKALTRYAQGEASQEYQNAYDRAMREYGLKYGKLSDLAGYGERAAGRSGAYQVGTAQDIGSLVQQGAAAEASGYGKWGPVVGTAGQSVADLILLSDIYKKGTVGPDFQQVG